MIQVLPQLARIEGVVAAALVFAQRGNVADEGVALQRGAQLLLWRVRQDV